MGTIYLVCAIVGGTILVAQTILMLIGLNDSDLHVDDVSDIDAGDHGGANLFFKVLSIKTLVAFVAFFGIAGKAADAAGSSTFNTFALALLAGCGAFVGVYYLGKALRALQSDTRFDLREAIGTTGEIYLPVPGQDEGRGKVILHVRGRRMECEASTNEEALEIGASVQVQDVLGSRWVRVGRTGRAIPSTEEGDTP